MRGRSIGRRRPLMPGDLVEVRSAAEIAATLDEQGCLDNLPFMPEMRQFCGRRIRVYRRADKTCDTVNRTGGRQQPDTVHLDGVRCDGSAHGGCQAACLIFWKEAWLKPAPDQEGELRDTGDPVDSGVWEENVSEMSGQDRIYRCQATQLPEFTRLLHWWDIRQYVRDLRTGNTTVGHFLRIAALAVFRALMRLGFGTRALVGFYNGIQKLRGGRPYPVIEGTLSKTPTAELGLQPGELVRVKTLDEINRTLDRQAKNRGMSFDPEMARFCGGTYRVASRVEQIIDERSGEMLRFATPGIILEDVFCRSEFSSCRLFCPRSIYSYWREIWLERVEEPG